MRSVFPPSPWTTVVFFATILPVFFPASAGESPAPRRDDARPAHSPDDGQPARPKAGEVPAPPPAGDPAAGEAAVAILRAKFGRLGTDGAIPKAEWEEVARAVGAAREAAAREAQNLLEKEVQDLQRRIDGLAAALAAEYKAEMEEAAKAWGAALGEEERRIAVRNKVLISGAERSTPLLREMTALRARIKRMEAGYELPEDILLAAARAKMWLEFAERFPTPPPDPKSPDSKTWDRASDAQLAFAGRVFEAFRARMQKRLEFFPWEPALGTEAVLRRPSMPDPERFDAAPPARPVDGPYPGEAFADSFVLGAALDIARTIPPRELASQEGKARADRIRAEWSVKRARHEALVKAEERETTAAFRSVLVEAARNIEEEIAKASEELAAGKLKLPAKVAAAVSLKIPPESERKIKSRPAPAKAEVRTELDPAEIRLQRHSAVEAKLKVSISAGGKPGNISYVRVRIEDPRNILPKDFMEHARERISLSREDGTFEATYRFPPFSSMSWPGGDTCEISMIVTVNRQTREEACEGETSLRVVLRKPAE
ncbi:MAG: hypothetical protein N3A38_09230 [Planctomycetota bacterium]|nr:hypothetical protein [Planctomycetota bacterium]